MTYQLARQDCMTGIDAIWTTWHNGRVSSIYRYASTRPLNIHVIYNDTKIPSYSFSIYVPYYATNSRTREKSLPNETRTIIMTAGCSPRGKQLVGLQSILFYYDQPCYVPNRSEHRDVRRMRVVMTALRAEALLATYSYYLKGSFCWGSVREWCLVLCNPIPDLQPSQGGPSSTEQPTVSHRGLLRHCPSHWLASKLYHQLTKNIINSTRHKHVIALTLTDSHKATFSHENFTKQSSRRLLHYLYRLHSFNCYNRRNMKCLPLLLQFFKSFPRSFPLCSDQTHNHTRSSTTSLFADHSHVENILDSS